MTRRMLCALLTSLCLAGLACADDLADPWKSKDLGDCGTKGSATVKDGKYTLKASGGDIWDQSDNFHFMYQPLSGDATIIAKVNSLENTNEWAKCGVMIREKLDAGSKHAMCVTTPGQKSHIQWRKDPGADSGYAENPVGDAAPYWVKLVRKDKKFTGFVSKDGKDWEKAGEIEIDMAKDVFIGVALTAHDNGQVTTAVVEQVTIEKPAN